MRLDAKGSQEFLGSVFGEIKFHINAIRRNMHGVTPEQYVRNEIMRDALSVRLQAIEGLIKRIGGKNIDKFGLRESFPDFPWNDFKGMRDPIAHDDSHISTAQPWEAYSETIPDLEKFIGRICNEYPDVKASMDSVLDSLEFEKSMDIEEYIESCHMAKYGKQKSIKPRRGMP